MRAKDGLMITKLKLKLLKRLIDDLLEKQEFFVADCPDCDGSMGGTLSLKFSCRCGMEITRKTSIAFKKEEKHDG